MRHALLHTTYIRPQKPYGLWGTGVLCTLTLFSAHYRVPYIFFCQCLSRQFLNEFNVPAITVLGGKLFQLVISLSFNI